MSARRRRLAIPYPMVTVLERELVAADAGPVFVWDIDKTYLESRFTRPGDLLRAAVEFGIDKRSIAGTVELLQGLRHGPGPRAFRPLFFISASPPQISSAIERRMLLDGIEWDGIFYKDHFKLFVRGLVDQMREQVAYKLSALLLLAERLPEGTRLHLFGDDVEKDALIYSLFADVAAGRLRGDALCGALRKQGTRKGIARLVAAAADRLPVRERVEGIHIRLERTPDGSTIRGFDERVRGYPTSWAAADELEQLGLIGPEAAARVRRVAPPSAVVRGAAPVDAQGWRTPVGARS